MKNEFYTDFIRPFVVLVVICLIVAALLGAANQVTAPIIEENDRIKAENTRMAALEGATGFSEVNVDCEKLGIIGAYRENSGKGYVISASYKGYGGGAVIVTVGLDNEGNVVGLLADVSTQTVGVGSKAGLSTYRERFLGLFGNNAAASVDVISGATLSSNAVKTGVNAALAAFPTVKEAAQ